jgi:Cu-processing system permease protein
MSGQLLLVARLEFTAATRLRWVRMLAIAFGVLAAACAHASGAAADIRGADGFARTTLAMVPIVLLLAPLSALLLGTLGQSADAEGDQFLFSQPLSRATVVWGRWLGDAVVMATAIGLGLGSGALYISWFAGPAGLGGFMLFTVAAVALAVVFLSLAAAIAAGTTRRGTALAAAAFTWLAFVLLYDGVALSLAVWLTGPSGGRALFASVFGNPVDLVRVLMLTHAGTPDVLGAAGDAWNRFLGGSAWATAAGVSALALWTAIPLGVAAVLIRRRDL